MSPKGLSGIREAAQEIEARRQSGGGGSTPFVALASGESAVVRFLEQGEDVAYCWTHEVPVANRQFGEDVPCIDQKTQGDPCPGCERELKRRIRGYINLIWRDGPVYKRDSDNKIIRDQGAKVIDYREDGVFIWQQGIQTFDELADKDITYKGLMSRDFRVTRKGEGLQTKYSIEPANPDGGAKPLSEADKKLAEGKPDLTEKVTPPTYTDFLRKLQGGSSGGGNGHSGEVNPNPFMRERD